MSQVVDPKTAKALILSGTAPEIVEADPSTGRAYILRVPPTMTTCHEAVAWTFDVAPGAYRPIEET